MYDMNADIVNTAKKRMNMYLDQLNRPNNLTTKENIKVTKILVQELAEITQSGNLQERDGRYYVI